MKNSHNFWNWFQDNNLMIKNSINDNAAVQKNISFWISKNLSYYANELAFMIVFPKNKKEKTEFIVSTNGNSDLIAAVLNLIDNAPQLWSWQFTACIESTNQINEVIKCMTDPFIFQEMSLKASQSIFLPLDHDQQSREYNIIFKCSNYSIFCNALNMQLAIYYILKDNRDLRVNKQSINFVQLAQKEEDNEGVIKLYDFQVYQDNLNRL